MGDLTLFCSDHHEIQFTNEAISVQCTLPAYCCLFFFFFFFTVTQQLLNLVACPHTASFSGLSMANGHSCCNVQGIHFSYASCRAECKVIPSCSTRRFQNIICVLWYFIFAKPFFFKVLLLFIYFLPCVWIFLPVWRVLTCLKMENLGTHVWYQCM